MQSRRGFSSRRFHSQQGRVPPPPQHSTLALHPSCCTSRRWRHSQNSRLLPPPCHRALTPHSTLPLQLCCCTSRRCYQPQQGKAPPQQRPLRAYTAACLTGLGCPPPPLSQACNQPLVQHILGCGVADHDEGRQAATPEALHINTGMCSAATRQDIGCCSAGTCWCVTVEAVQGSRELCLQQHHCPKWPPAPRHPC